MAAPDSNSFSYPHPPTQDEGEANTSIPLYCCTFTKTHPIPAFISPIEKEIVAAGVVRLGWDKGLSPKYMLYLGPSAKDIAHKTMNEDAQRSAGSRRIWNNIFEQGKKIRREDLLENDIFNQNTWKTLYDCVRNHRVVQGGVDISPQKLLGATNEETRKNLKRWEEAQDEKEEQWRKLSVELQKE